MFYALNAKPSTPESVQAEWNMICHRFARDKPLPMIWFDLIKTDIYSRLLLATALHIAKHTLYKYLLLIWVFFLFDLKFMFDTEYISKIVYIGSVDFNLNSCIQNSGEPITQRLHPSASGCALNMVCLLTSHIFARCRWNRHDNKRIMFTWSNIALGASRTSDAYSMLWPFHAVAQTRASLIVSALHIRMGTIKILHVLNFTQLGRFVVCSQVNALLGKITKIHTEFFCTLGKSIALTALYLNLIFFIDQQNPHFCITANSSCAYINALFLSANHLFRCSSHFGGWLLFCQFYAKWICTSVYCKCRAPIWVWQLGSRTTRETI